MAHDDAQLRRGRVNQLELRYGDRVKRAMSSPQPLSTLEQAETEHVCRAARDMLWWMEAGGLEQSGAVTFDEALEGALELYATRRRLRVGEGEPLAVALSAQPPSGKYPCAVSGRIFTCNVAVQAQLASRDPWLYEADKFIRQWRSSGERGERGEREDEKDLAVTTAGLATGYAAFFQRTTPPPASTLPLEVELCGHRIEFPSHRAWAAFAANHVLWSPETAALRSGSTCAPPVAPTMLRSSHARRPTQSQPPHPPQQHYYAMPFSTAAHRQRPDGVPPFVLRGDVLAWLKHM